MSDDRRLDVLRAIVEDYVATREPVGSKALLERHDLGVSAATVRNDMAALEDEGYITAPHTSAGRIPTDQGYRVFVDRLTQVKPLSAPERRAIEHFLTAAVDVDDVVQRSVKVLAQLTQQVAIVQYPSLTRSTVRHVEIVQLDPARLLLVVIASSGRVEQRIVEIAEPVSEQLVTDLRDRMVAATSGIRLVEAASALTELIETFDLDGRAVATSVVSAMAEIVSDERGDDRIAVGGAANLARFGSDFDSAIRPVLEALEEQVVLLKLLGEATAHGVSIRIGHETGHEALATTSVVSTPYGSAEHAIATLGTVGPTHMDYPSTIAAVAAVSRYVGRTLNENWSFDR